MVTRKEMQEREREVLGWRAIAILAASGEPDAIKLVRGRLILWAFRAPEEDDVRALMERAKEAGVRSGIFVE